MCLDRRFTPEVEKMMIAKLPDGLITVYKVVRKKNSSYEPLFWQKRFRVGCNYAQAASPENGYHSFKTRRGAKAGYAWLCGTLVVKMQIRKEWITVMGKHGNCLAYVTDRIISPSLRDKSAVVG